MIGGSKSASSSTTRIMVASISRDRRAVVAAGLSTDRNQPAWLGSTRRRSEATVSLADRLWGIGAPRTDATLSIVNCSFDLLRESFPPLRLP